MSAKLELANRLQSERAKKIERDYWRIERFECLATAQDTFLIQGRRRSSEAFWPGLRLDWETLQRFNDTMRNAVTVAAGISVDEEQTTDCVFPDTETLAICQGSEYVIETTETLDGFGKRSICTTVFSLGQPLLPSVHLIDDELNQFSQDIEEVLDHICCCTN